MRAATGFGFGRDIQNDQAKQGLQQQIMNQALIDSAGQQYQGYINSPQMAQSSFGDYLNTSSLVGSLVNVGPNTRVH